MSIPAMFTLLTLLRIESENAVDRKKMQWQVLEVLQERSLLQQNQPLSMPVEQLSVSQSPASVCRMVMMFWSASLSKKDLDTSWHAGKYAASLQKERDSFNDNRAS